MCSFDELKAVQAHIESLDNADLRSAYNKQRKDFVEEVQSGSLFIRRSLSIVKAYQINPARNSMRNWAATKRMNRSQELEEVRQDRKKA
jgi:hypothetical protein